MVRVFLFPPKRPTQAIHEDLIYMSHYWWKGLKSRELRGKMWSCVSSVSDPHENMGSAFINKQICGRHTSALCHLWVLQTLHKQLAACARWDSMVPRIPVSHWEHTAWSTSSSATKSQKMTMMCLEMAEKWLWWWCSHYPALSLAQEHKIPKDLNIRQGYSTPPAPPGPSVSRPLLTLPQGLAQSNALTLLL